MPGSYAFFFGNSIETWGKNSFDLPRMRVGVSIGLIAVPRLYKKYAVISSRSES
jgi:hypothetical protein